MKIKINLLKYFILVLPYFEPLLFKEVGFETIDNLYTIGKIISFLYVGIIYVYRRKEYNELFLTIFFLEIIIAISTIIYNGDINRFIGPCVSILGMTILTDYYYPKLKLDFFKVNYIILYFQMLINIITIFVFPDGILRNNGGSRIYFLGIPNRFIFTLIPLIFFALLYSIKKYRKINLVAFSTIALSLLSTVSQWSVGASLGLIFIALSIVVFNNISIFNKITINHFLVIVMILNILVVFVQIQNYFEDFIVNVLKKDVTLTGRTIIWSNAIEIVKAYPIIGVGIQPIKVLAKLYCGVGHTHNMLLSYLTTSGIFGTILYIYIFLILSKAQKKIKDVKVKALFSTTIFVILFLSIADSLDSGIFFMVYMTIFKYKESLENEENRNFNF